jgi:sugar phosphate isomerase/epimerase
LPTESREARLLPGEGILDFDSVADALDSICWSGVISTEVLSVPLRERPARELAQACHRAAARFFRDDPS